jgi:type I restriction enzyme S subunit
MTIVSKASAYPKSVQSGLPRLGTCPPGWTRGPLSAHLTEELRPLNMADDEVYDLVTVKRSRGGVVLRERLKGSEIAVKTQFRLKAGDFLISKRQIVHGACGIVPPELDGAIVSNEYSILRARPTLDLDFLNCLAHSIYFQQTCFHSSIGVHVEKMIFKLDEWMKWDFDLPPLTEQRRIVRILSCWRRAASTLASLLANTKAEKTAIMQQVYSGRRRFPGFDDAWKATSISDIAQVVMGSSPPSEAYNSDGEGLPLIQGNADIQGRTSVPRFYTRVVTQKCQPGDIIFSVRAPVGEVARSVHQACLGRGVAAIRARSPHDTDFLYFRLMKAEPSWARLSQGSTFQAITGADLKGYRLQTPQSSEERRSIGEAVRTAQGSEDGVRSQLSALRFEEAALMQQLLTGKRRVKISESEAA